MTDLRPAAELGVPTDTVAALEEAFLAEREARQRRTQLIYPDRMPF